MLFVKLLIALAICLQLPVIALAHPGRTDSSGGHTDHDSGEYHYHHGYPAHDHYDMDGDGIPNCPYDSDFQPNYATIKKDSPSDGEGSLSPFDIELEEELERLRKDKQNSSTYPTKPSIEITTYPKTTQSFWDFASDKLISFGNLIWDLLVALWNLVCALFDYFLGWACFFVICIIIGRIFRKKK